jgi:tRNA 2-thiocytidine biosynthesis protein TtcA
MFTAMMNVKPSHMLDRDLFDFNNFELKQGAAVDGDILFDSEESKTGQSVVTFM